MKKILLSQIRFPGEPPVAELIINLEQVDRILRDLIRPLGFARWVPKGKTHTSFWETAAGQNYE